MDAKELLDIRSYPDAVYRSDFFDRLAWRENRPKDMKDSPALGWRQLTQEVFGRMYGYPSKLDEDAIRPEFAHLEGIHNQLSEEMAEWQQLEQAVKGEATLAGLATRDVAEVAAKLLEACKAPTESENNMAELEDQMGNPSGKQAIQNKSKCAANSMATDAGRAALRAAVSRAKEDAQDTQRAAHAIGWGNTPGQALDKGEAQAAKHIMELMRKDARIRTIIHALGKMNGHASRAFFKSGTMSSELHDVTLGSDVERMLGNEVLKVAVPQLKGLWAKSFMERGLMQYELSPPPERVGRGDAILLVDVSGSMMGEPEAAAKAFAAVAALRMRKEHRQAWLGCFDTRLYPNFGIATPASIVDLIEQTFSGGGTNFDQPVLTLPSDCLKSERADLVFVTDGFCTFSNQKAIARIAEKFGRVLVVLVGGGTASGFEPLINAGVQVLVANMAGSADDERFSDVFRDLID